jgi:hypothetical protein
MRKVVLKMHSSLARICTSLDGYVTTPDGWPVQLADPNFSPENYGFTEFQQRLNAVLMGRTTFEPALGAQRWPWPNLDELGLIVLPLLLGGGMQLTPSLSTETPLTLTNQRVLPSGPLELIYTFA